MRREDWEARLIAVIARYEAMPFAWGSADCTTFAADCAAAQRSDDPFAHLRGRYSTRTGAARVLKREGGEMADVIARRLDRVALPFAGRGDLCLVTTDAGPAAAVMLGSEVIAQGEDGLTRLPRGAATAAFRV